MKLSRYSTHLGLIGMAALWGASWPWGRVVAQAMPPLAAASLRFLLASLALLCWLYTRDRLQSLRVLTPRQWVSLTIASSIGVLGYSSFFMLALQIVPAGKAAMVVALNPVLTMLLAVLLFRELTNWLMNLGLVLAVAGAFYALSDGSLKSLLFSQSGTGELLLLGCVASWVSYTLIGRKILNSIDSLTTSCATAITGGLLLLATSLIVEGRHAWTQLSNAPVSAWSSMLALSFGATTLGYAWYLKGVQDLGAGSAAAYLALVPLFGILFSALWLGEPLSHSLVIGGTAAIIGMLLMNQGRYWTQRTIRSNSA